MEQAALEAMGTEELAAAIAACHRSITAQQADLLAMIAAYAERGAWAVEGASSMQAWVCAALNVSYSTAGQWVRAAQDLSELPVIASAFASGSLSLDAASAAARLATPATDAHVASEAAAVSADALRAAARRQEAVEAQNRPGADRTGLRWSFTAEGWCRFSGNLPPEEAACVIAALEREEGGVTRDPETGEWPKASVAAAHALVSLASRRLASDQDPDRACVVVHAPAEALISGEGSGQLSCGGAVSAECVRKLACDGRIEIVAHREATGEGGVVGIGRATRQIPDHIGRYLHHRDQTCRFPGCGKASGLHAHHIEHWANGGKTDVTNLALLCRQHHTFVHENHWAMTGNPEPGPGVGDTLTFTRPDGSVLQPRERAASWRRSGPRRT